MADQLATADDLATLLGVTFSVGEETRAELLIELATAVVQEAAGGQRIVQVVDDTNEQMGTGSQWLEMPQIPVTEVSDVTIDGEAVTDWTRFGNKLYRACGWANCGPSTVAYTYTHGWEASAQELQLARSAVLGLVRGVWDNPTGVTSEAIDDYRVTFDKVAAAMDATPYLAKAIRHRYGHRAGPVTVG